MAKTTHRDKSNGYEDVAEHFIAARNPRIGPATVREWSKSLAPGSIVLDVACGYGVPITKTLIEAGFTVYGVDASAKLVAEFRKRFPHVPIECAAAEDSEFFSRKFDGIVAWGLMFLLPADIQPVIIRKAAEALKPGGRFLFTAHKQVVTWNDSLTGLESISLGGERYEQILRDAGLTVVGEAFDEGDNHYYFLSKP
ncbi:MAG TPA: class I SAM-dependent methyltransferase [Candidatus Angelobacter sp.]